MLLTACLAAQFGRDPCDVPLQRFRHIDEVNGRLTTDVAVADQVAQQPGLIRRHWLVGAEAQEATRPRYAVTAGEFPREEPAALGQDLVVWRDPKLGAVAQPEADDLLLALVEPG